LQDQLISIKLNLSLDTNANVIVNVERETGNMFYFRKLSN